MKLGRTALFGLLAVSLAACGGGDSNNSGPIGGGGDGGGIGNVATCSLSARQDWALSVLQEWYLYPDLLNTSVNKADYTTLQGYLNAVTAPGQALFNPDGLPSKTFTYITSIEEENELINSGSNAGFGIRLTYDTLNNRVFVVEAFENGPSFLVGFDRGTEILQIGGQSVSALMASGGPGAVVDALGPGDPGVTRSFVIRSVSGVQQNASVTKEEFSLDPISDRYGVRVLSDGAGGQVGYINLRTFIVQDAGPQLIDAFQQFRTQGISNIILDMRYNGGGLVSVADLLGDLMGEGLEGQVFSETNYRPSKSANDSIELFQEQAQQIAPMRLAIIGRGGTASASELVSNSMIPYLGDNIALVGTDTYGKPVGQNAFDRSACDDRLRAVTFKTVNANGQGDYFGGLASVMPNTCIAGDDISNQLGDPNEQSVSVALDFIAGRTCTPISAAAKDGRVQAEAGRRELLQPLFPSAAQHENPGLF
ncbi:S41 family peptidase [Erythrobacter sp. SD-21]|uniref:S41 family peptidase n=1 Tax=Erythrobacter sp. SD-21 TaxID=161528 RepID=UPI000153EF86|nr:S41 family peptidase [Erythrobacter sp. SD-21]EDL49236.1 Carboxyl-terminal protease [Erythrobacter sp. SD-21]